MEVSTDQGRGAMSRAEAEAFTLGIGQTTAGNLELLEFGFRNGVHEALDLSFPDWVKRIGGYVDRSRKERRAIAKRLHDQDLSTREIGAILGVNHSTVVRDLTGASAPPATGAKRSVAGGTGADAPHVGQNAGDDAWYTPAEFIAAAVSVLGGIDLDPASSPEANAVVGAARYYTAEDDGLAHPWAGRVWLNPPYRQPAVDRFCTRLAREYAAGTVTAAIALVNNATETAWFQEVAAQCAALCFPRGRVKFWHPAKESAPLQGQALLYLGDQPAGFRGAFLRFGFVTERLAGGAEG
jgi:phage N-6-adenine-methyltransferase